MNCITSRSAGSRALLALGLTLLLQATARTQTDTIEALPELLEGVATIASPGTPSPLAVWSKDAYVVLAGNGGKGLRSAAIVGGHAKAGRFVALPHNGYFAGDALKQGDTGRFLVNCTRWLAGSTSSPKIVVRTEDLRSLLAGDALALKAKFDVRLLEAGPLMPQLAGIDVLLGLSSELADGEIDALEEWIRAGGGVLAGQCAWGWLQVSGKASLDENSLQQLFGRFGVAWCDGYLGKSGPEGFTTERDPPKLAHGDAAFTYLANHTVRRVIKAEQPMLQSSATMTAVARVLPAGDLLLRPKLEAERAKRADAIEPTPDKPLERIDGGDRAMLAYIVREADRVAAEEVKPLGAAKSFPGLPPAAAPRLTKTIALDTALPRWHSTGLYAAPGEVITLTLPEAAAAVRIALQIGAHTDVLFDLAAWHRVPKAFVRRPVTATTTKLAAPLGGLIYVDVPEGLDLGKVDVTLAGGIAAPWFVAGRDDDATWNASLRELPAPWAELECDRIIVTVPSSAIRNLAEPTKLMELWAKGADAMADLVGIPRARPSPERFVADVQIGAGYMHSGYPIMTHLDAATAMSDPAELAKGQWGLFHELGHNHQEPEWTFDGTGEVTNNVLCIHALESVFAVPVTKGHDAIEGTAKKVADYVKAGANFDEWKGDPFLALQMYVQLQQQFGWELYKKVFADYRALPRRERPRTDDAKRDLWLVMLSKVADRNLGPFFTAWGVPTSDTARASVADRAAWMPESFPPR
ncbi:MAG: hypothetical protein EXS13_10100 [Planctomycetes bacterium]|nr:hypothetical protein [Planctomycetota bacterium]